MRNATPYGTESYLVEMLHRTGKDQRNHVSATLIYTND